RSGLSASAMAPTTCSGDAPCARTSSNDSCWAWCRCAYAVEVYRCWFWYIPVATPPSWTTRTRIPSGPASRASASLSASSACLLAACTPLSGNTACPATDDTLTTVPSPRSRIAGRNAEISRSGPTTLVSNIARATSAGASSTAGATAAATAGGSAWRRAQVRAPGALLVCGCRGGRTRCLGLVGAAQGVQGKTAQVVQPGCFETAAPGGGLGESAVEQGERRRGVAEGEEYLGLQALVEGDQDALSVAVQRSHCAVDGFQSGAGFALSRPRPAEGDRGVLGQQREAVRLGDLDRAGAGQPGGVPVSRQGGQPRAEAVDKRHQVGFAGGLGGVRRLADLLYRAGRVTHQAGG